MPRALHRRRLGLRLGGYQRAGQRHLQETASVTAWNDLDASVTSTADWVEVFAGRNITGDLTGKYQVNAEARGSLRLR
jgi:hypothetical protein